MNRDNSKEMKLPFGRYGIIALLLVAFLCVGGISAKYIHQNSERNLFAAKEFYFTSDLLKEEGASYVLNSNTTSFTFTLRNNADELRFSEDDIAYTVTVTGKDLENGDVTPLINRGTDTPTSNEMENVKLAGDTVSVDTITVSNLVSGKTYEVTATGNAGYKTTLTATFTISDEGENIYKYLDTSNEAYVVLTVWTENIIGTVNISFPEVPGLIPDNTDVILRGVQNYQAADATQNLSDGYLAITAENPIADAESFTEEYSSRTYRFFIDEASDFNVEKFNVVLIQGENQYIATSSTP